MHTLADKAQENESQSVASEKTQLEGCSESTLQFEDNRPEAVTQRKFREMANKSPQAKEAGQWQTVADNHIARQQHPVQKKKNNTGLPDNLKSGIENLSGFSMDDVKVHKNSDKPAQLNARAYVQGTDIHVGPGQEKHLPHEAWHVVQQKQGRVTATNTIQKVKINDNPVLENEATHMGRLAAHYQPIGSANAPYRMAAHTVYHSDTVQRVSFLELTDSQQEVVDHFVQQLYKTAADNFEIMIGKRSSADPRSHKAADELLERTVLLVETMFFNTTKHTEKSLEAYYSDIFGMKERPDITGTVGADTKFIQEVFHEGSFREKMTLFYVALAESRMLNKMLLEYQKLLTTEIKAYGPGGKKENLAYTAKVRELQGLNEYAGHKAKRSHLIHAMTYVQTEIDLERRADLKARGIHKEVLDAEQRKERKQNDEALAIAILQMVNQDGITGNELDKVKLKQYKALVTLFMRLNASLTDAKLKDPQAYQKHYADVNKHKALYEAQIVKRGQLYSGGFGWIKELIKVVYADNQERIIKEIEKAAKEQDADLGELIKYFKKQVAEDAFIAMGSTMFDPPKVKRSDTVLKEALTRQLNDSLKKLPAWAKSLHDQKEDKTGAKSPDETADKIAHTRFQLGFDGPSMFYLKKGIEASRVGGARVLVAHKDQLSDQTPNELEKDESSRMSYRELAASFYTPKEFAELLAKFKNVANVAKKDLLTGEHKEQLRKIMLAQHGDKTLPWKPGMKYWQIDTKSPIMQAAEILKVKVGAAVSGSTDRVMRGAKYLGFAPGELRDVLLACMGWMIPAGDHTFYEIMKAGEPYVKMAPPKNPFPDLPLDTDYGFGVGYDKMLTFFPDLNPKDLPQHLLTLEYKDLIAAKLFPKKADVTLGDQPKEEEDATLKVMSDKEGKIVHTGEPVTYFVRNKAKHPFRYEWFWLRHEGGQARANIGSVENRFPTVWKYKGIYKIYCLVYPTEGKQQQHPVATLRYDQVVYSAKESAESVEEHHGLPHHQEDEQVVSAKATYTSLEGVIREVPIKVRIFPFLESWIGRIEAPKDLTSDAGTVLYFGKVKRSDRLEGAGDFVQTYNQIFRKDRSPALAQSEAVYLAAKKWGEEQKYKETGSINVDVFDTKTHVILKEHFIYTDRLGTNITDLDSAVPSFRVQGGDFQAQIKSHVRLVETRTGDFAISGNAMVWINFGDKGRMVWWLNNRSDRSYSVNFSVTSGLLSKIAGEAVPEKEANEAENEGKPIISADKATHQYAINKEGNKGKYTSFKELKKFAVGQIAKMFQWKTFDIASLEGPSIMPKGKGKLASGFNEDLRKAKDLEIKIRLLKVMDPTSKELPELEAEYEKLNKLGKARWRSDFIYNLRKPGDTDMGKRDRRTRDELGEEELMHHRHSLAETYQSKVEIRKIVGANVAPLIVKLDKIKVWKGSKPDQKKRNYKEIRKDALDILQPAFAAIRKAFKSDESLLASVGDLPDEFGKNILVLAVNKEISRLLDKKCAMLRKLDTTDRGKLLSYLNFSYKGVGNRHFGKPVEKNEDEHIDFDQTTSVETSSSGEKTTGASSKDGKPDAVNLAALRAHHYDFVKKEMAEGGIENPNTTCYIASVMQMVAYSQGYRQLFQDQLFNLQLPEDRRTVIYLGNLILASILGGFTVPLDLIRNYRTALFTAGWTAGSGDHVTSQQDVGMFMRWLLEDFFNIQMGVQAQHDLVKIGHYSRTAQSNERIVQVGGLKDQLVNNGRTLQNLVEELYTMTHEDQERDGIPIRHRFKVTSLPLVLTIQVMRYDFNQVLGVYSPKNEIITVGDELIFQGELSPREDKKYTYLLQSFIVHLGGSPKGGHYIMYFRKGRTWFCANDENVQPVSAEAAGAARNRGYIFHFVKLSEETVPVSIFALGDRERRRHERDPAYKLELMYKELLRLKNNPDETEAYLSRFHPDMQRSILAFFEEHYHNMNADAKQHADLIIATLRRLI